MCSCFRQLFRLFCWQVVFFSLLGMTDAFGQIAKESLGSETDSLPGIPPGLDRASHASIGQPPTIQGQIQAMEHALQSTVNDGKFHLIEASISDIHAALKSGR